jgi:hypothetical protein
MQEGTYTIAFALAISVIQIAPAYAASASMVAEFHQTCVVSRSATDLKAALAKNGWKAFTSLAQSHLEREIELVTPMLDAQGLSSNYTIYGRDIGGKHFELAFSETKKPLKDDRDLIGCSIYDFDATAPIDTSVLNAFAPSAIGQRKMLGDAQFESWTNPFGEGSGMRAVFVPSTSPAKAQLGFSGMMLGTHFLNAK